MESVKICVATLGLADDLGITATELRGCLARKFADEPEFHHHSANSYHYPLIQYKVLNGQPTIIGACKFADIILDRLPRLKKITVRGSRINVSNVMLKKLSYSLTLEDGKYEFVSPWLALNSSNYNAFIVSEESERRNILQKVLVGNILSMLKGLDIFIHWQISINIFDYQMISTPVHGNLFVGFKASFLSNSRLPVGLGLGKSVSKGFGVIGNVA